MNLENAIKNLEFIYETESDAELMEACKAGISAVRKQIPAKVEITMMSYQYRCPTCGRIYDMTDMGTMYCCQCGQALEW